MHQNAPFWGNFPKNSRGDPPRPPPAGGDDTLPLSALRASVKPLASDLGAPAVFNRAPEEKMLDTPDDVNPHPNIGIFESPKCDVNPQPNTWGIGPLVGRTSGNRRSVMHVLAVIFSITDHFFFICQYIFIQAILSGREIYPLLMYPSTFLIF